MKRHLIQCRSAPLYTVKVVVFASVKVMVYGVGSPGRAVSAVRRTDVMPFPV